VLSFFKMNLFPIFQGKGKPDRNLDAFDRDHAPLYMFDTWKREYVLANAQVEKVLEMAGKVDFEDTYSDKAVQELARRKDLITKGDNLKKKVIRVLEAMEKYSTKVDEESNRLRQEIANYISSILPDVNSKLDRIDAVIQSELTRLTAANKELIQENERMKVEASGSKDSGKVENLLDQMQRNLDVTNQKDTAEVQRLMRVEAEYKIMTKQWNESKKDWEVDEARLEKERDDLWRENQASNNEKRQKDDTIGQLVTRLSRVEDEKKALEEKISLGESGAEKDSKIAKLESTIKRMDMEFEWVKGRSLEYYGQLQTANRDNQALREAAEELCDTLSAFKAEAMELREQNSAMAAEEAARDELIDQMSQATRALESLRTSRRTSFASAMDWQTTPTGPAEPSNNAMSSRQLSPCPRTQSAMSLSASLPGLASTRPFSRTRIMNWDSPSVSFNDDSYLGEGSSSTSSRTPAHRDRLNRVGRSMIPVPSARASTNPFRGTEGSLGGAQRTSSGGFGLNDATGSPTMVARSSAYTSSYVPRSGPMSAVPGMALQQAAPQAQFSPAPGTSPIVASSPSVPQAAPGFSFLVSGSLATGPRTLAVNPQVLQEMHAQVQRWATTARSEWNSGGLASHKRCVDTRIVSRLSLRRNPPASDNPNEACRICVNRRLLCVLIGDHGPVVVPLPLADRSPGASPMQGDYYIKTRVPVPAVLPLPQATVVPPPPAPSGLLPQTPGLFGQGTRSTRTQGQSSSAAGSSSTPLQHVSYSFLVSGELANGPRTLAVDPSLLEMMNQQVSRWEGRPEWATIWKASIGTSAVRCSESRVLRMSKSRSPHAPNPTSACQMCIQSRKLCVLVGENGPVVMPLPVSERSPGATPLAGDYYVKTVASDARSPGTPFQQGS
jgi:hypothetical protein